MKKVLVMCLIMCFGIVGCGNKDKEDSSSGTENIMDIDGETDSEKEETEKNTGTASVEDVVFDSTIFNGPDSITYSYQHETVIGESELSASSTHFSSGTYEFENIYNEKELVHEIYFGSDGLAAEEYYYDLENKRYYYHNVAMEEEEPFHYNYDSDYDMFGVPMEPGNILYLTQGTYAVRTIQWKLDESNQDSQYYVFTCDDLDSLKEYITWYLDGPDYEYDVEAYSCVLKYDRVNRCLVELNIEVDYTYEQTYDQKNYLRKKSDIFSLTASDINSTVVEIPQDLVDNAILVE